MRGPLCLRPECRRQYRDVHLRAEDAKLTKMLLLSVDPVEHSTGHCTLDTCRRQVAIGFIQLGKLSLGDMSTWGAVVANMLAPDMELHCRTRIAIQ